MQTNHKKNHYNILISNVQSKIVLIIGLNDV